VKNANTLQLSKNQKLSDFPTLNQKASILGILENLHFEKFEKEKESF